MERKVGKILTVADEETGLSCTAHSPLQCPVYFYYAYIIQMELPLFLFQASSTRQAASQLQCFLILESSFYLSNTSSFYSISFLQKSFQTQGVVFLVFWEKSTNQMLQKCGIFFCTKNSTLWFFIQCLVAKRSLPK